MVAFQDILKYRGRLPEDFDADKELAELITVYNSGVIGAGIPGGTKGQLSCPDV